MEKRSAVIRTPISLGDIDLHLPELARPEDYIQACLARGQGGTALPYWTKLWPASLLLASLVAGIPLNPGDSVIELGAGLGLPGLVAARRGCRVVLTDSERDALEFGRAAAEMNGLEDRVSVRALDWSAPPRDLGIFSLIMGAEILHGPGSVERLAGLLPGLLQPEAKIFFSHQKEHISPAFFSGLGEEFNIRQKTHTMPDDDEPAQILLHNLRPKG